MTKIIKKQKMFRYIENKDSTFLLGAYRGEKSQLDWILGEKTQRYEKLYNIRFNKDLFSQRKQVFVEADVVKFLISLSLFSQNPIQLRFLPSICTEKECLIFMFNVSKHILLP